MPNLRLVSTLDVAVRMIFTASGTWKAKSSGRSSPLDLRFMPINTGVFLKRFGGSTGVVCEGSWNGPMCFLKGVGIILDWSWGSAAVILERSSLNGLEKGSGCLQVVIEWDAIMGWTCNSPGIWCWGSSRSCHEFGDPTFRGPRRHEFVT